MINTYPLEWIDSLILITLDPKKTNISDLSENDLVIIAENLSKESHKIQIQLKNELFALQKKRQIRLLVRKYHSTFVYLLDNVIEHQKNKALQNGILPNIIGRIINTLDELITFVENRYYNYLSLDERVPIPYLLVSRKEMLLKLAKLQKRKMENVADSLSMQIVLNALSNLIDSKAGYKVTYREILYQKELLKRLDLVTFTADSSDFYTAIDELLLEFNFNQHQYITHFIDKIEYQLDLRENLTDKLSEILLYFKEYKQLPSSEKITFDPSKQNIGYVLDNWFHQEINYLERKIALSHESEFTKSDEFLDIADSKVQCILSTDQMGLILRAGDEARILKAKSMNQVFRSIVPYLSTIRKKNLSYDSMRSKSYTAEERDKEIAIQTLERIIKHIKEF